MSRGKYSPVFPNYPLGYKFEFNCYGEAPTEYIPGEMEYDEEIMFDIYDEEGYDDYGYSAFDGNGNYVGPGKGVDRAGYTEMDYLTLKDIPEEHRDSYFYYND